MLHKALREFALHVDPEVTREYLGDLRRMDALGQDYEALAREPEQQMLRAITESMDDHRTLAEMAERWSS